MKRIPFLAVVALAASLLFVSCKNSGISDLAIPKDAAMIVHIDGKSLASKLSWKEIQENQWFKDLYENADDSLLKKILDNPSNSGVDVKSGFVFFMQPQGKSLYAVFEGSLKDASDFEAMLKTMNRRSKIEKDGDLQYIINDDDNILSWTKSKFIFVGNSPMNERDYYRNNEGKNAASTADDLKKYTQSLLSLKKDNSIESNDRFTALVKEEGDIHFWMNMESYASLMPKMGNNPATALFSSMSKMFKGNINTGTVSFDNGKITMKSKQFFGEEMKKIFDKYKMQNITEDMVNKIPSQNVAAAFVANYPPEAAKEFVKAANLDGMANMFLGKYGLNVSETIDATKGQMIFALTDVAVDTAAKPNFFFSMPAYKFFVGISVNNKAAFDKLVTVVESQLKDSSEEKNPFMPKVNYQVTNDWFVMSNSPESSQSFLSGATANQPFASRITGHPIGGYIDIQKIISAFKSGQSNFMLDASMSTWQDVVMTGGDYKDGISTSEVTINFVDKNTNSLKQLNQYSQKMYEAQKKRQMDMMKDYQTEDTKENMDVQVVPQN